MRRIVTTLMISLLMAWLPQAETAQASAGYSYGDTQGKSDSCIVCHALQEQVGKKFHIDPILYRQTTHARIGCSSCHDTITGDHRGRKTAKAQCMDCHSVVAEEYGASLHAGNTGCGGCHNPHRVSSPTEISGQDVRRMCSSCHNIYSIRASHARWLPQADLHVEMLPCTTCHTPSKEYVVMLYVVKANPDRMERLRALTFEELRKHSEARDILSLVDINNDGYISLAELKIFNKTPPTAGIRLQAMMTPEKTSHRFDILGDRSDCTYCHVSGPKAMQTSYLALPGENGTFQRYPVEKGAVLETLYAAPDFYLTGATRDRTLNWLGLAIIAGGMVMPVGHGFLRFLTRKNRKEDHHE